MDADETTTVEVVVPRETETASDVVVVDTAPAEGETVDHAIDAAVETERRLAELERRMGELQSEQWNNVTHEEARTVAEDVVADAVVDAAVVADEVATQTAESVAEEVVEDAVEEVDEAMKPHRKTHWLHRPWGEWKRGE